MNKRCFIFQFILLAIVSLWCFSQDTSQAPMKYEMKLIYVFEGKEPEYIFVIGNSGFKSIETLKQFLRSLPAGSEITWNPGCRRLGNEPLLSSEKEMDSFKIFLKSKGIKFKLIPSG
jgi:hypothetical protein